jgi:hypothetical protein
MNLEAFPFPAEIEMTFVFREDSTVGMVGHTCDDFDVMPRRS